MSPVVASESTGSHIGDETSSRSTLGRVMALADREMTLIQKWTGQGLDECGRLGRLLLFRNLALQADLQCKWDRSDFFWLESHRQLRALLRDPKVWIGAAQFAGMDTNRSGALRDAVVDELFVRTHLALHRAAARLSPEKPGPDEREFAYVRYLRGVFDAAGTEASRQAEFLVPLADRWIDVESEAKHWTRAIAITRDMIGRLPQELRYPEKLILLEFQSARDGLSDGPLKPRDARKLKAGIERIEQLRVQYPWIPLAFTLVGRLRHLRAIALANNNELSEALVESQKGMDYLPGDEEAAKTDARLVENMKTLRARMEVVLQQVRTGYNKRLTAEGQKLANEATRGFTPVNQYISSAERTKLQQDAIAARNKSIWLEAGYSKEAATEWDACAARLYVALTEVLGKAPSDRAQLEHLLNDQIAQEPLLAGLDPRPAIDLLARRVFPAEQPAPELATPPTADNLPDLKFESTKRVRGDEPFLFWMFSRQGMPLKIQASAALLVLLCALSLTVFDAVRRSRQDHAYRAVIAASNAGDYTHVVDFSEDFLSHPALHYDDRTPQVKSLYSEALVRWFSGIPGTPDQAALKRVGHYRQLTGQTQ